MSRLRRYWLQSHRGVIPGASAARRTEKLLSGGSTTAVVTTGIGPAKGLLGVGDPVKSDKGNVVTQEFIKFTPENPHASSHLFLGKT